MEDDREREAGWLDGWQLNPLLLLFRPTIVAGCVSLSVSSGEITSSICQHFAQAARDFHPLLRGNKTAKTNRRRRRKKESY
jgi:hypothetical protein